MTPSYAAHSDTITARATAPGRGGVAIVRVSGPAVKKIILHVLGSELIPRQATYLPFLDEKGDTVDEGLAIFFPHPHSFTGEDVLELHGHGGPVIIDLLLQRVLTLGARLARPGEFSERAFLNGKMDLTQAEAIADLIDASSREAARSAVRSLQGEFSKAIHALTGKVVYLRMYIEAAIDFTDEEIDFLNDATLLAKLNQIADDFATIQQKATQGNFLREGISAVIVGEPNVGKSSLLNCLSGKDIAIVTDIPGTTRDVLRNHILIDGMPMHIIDTAGLRESDDVVEQEGIRRAYDEMAQADIILYVTDATKPIPPSLPINETFSCPLIVIQNKIDLLHTPPSPNQKESRKVISLSAKSGEGIDLLKDEIKNQVGFHSHQEGLYLARRRHLDALKNAHEHVTNGLAQLNMKTSPELAADDLRLAQRSLNEITGEFTADDLLGRIFSSFCIGK